MGWLDFARDGTPTGLGVDEFLGEIHPKILEVLYCVDDPLCLISHLPSRKDRLTNSDRASVTMENLQMAMLVWASRQKSDGVGTQIDDAGDSHSRRSVISIMGQRSTRLHGVLFLVPAARRSRCRSTFSSNGLS